MDATESKDTTVKRRELPAPPARFDSQDSGLDIEAIQSAAIDDSIGKILHEIEPAIGAIKIIASEEIDDYINSETVKEFKKLDDLLATFEDWRKVEQSARLRKENIYEIVLDVVGVSADINVSLKMDKDLTFSTDRSLIRIVFSNAIRNAKESCEMLDTDEKPEIVVSGGVSDKGLWASVVDQGIGLPAGQATVLRNRQSTKPGHRGMGLPLIHKAVTVLGGSWELKESAASGAAFYFEIPRRSD